MTIIFHCLFASSYSTIRNMINRVRFRQVRPRALLTDLNRGTPYLKVWKMDQIFATFSWLRYLVHFSYFEVRGSSVGSSVGSACETLAQPTCGLYRVFASCRWNCSLFKLNIRSCYLCRFQGHLKTLLSWNMWTVETAWRWFVHFQCLNCEQLYASLFTMKGSKQI